jgi:hypothetical protein
MRRRTGASSNHLEAAGKIMNRIHKTSDEHHAEASAAGSFRIPIGSGTPDAAVYGQMDEINPSQMRGTLVPKKNVQAGDPTAGGKANRANIEKVGATYRVQPKTTYVQLDPAAGPTMASARIIPSISGRSGFQAGIQASEA